MSLVDKNVSANEVCPVHGLRHECFNCHDKGMIFQDMGGFKWVQKCFCGRADYAPSGASKAVAELEEIQEAAQRFKNKYEGAIGYEWYTYDTACFMDGALWMKDKLNGK